MSGIIGKKIGMTSLYDTDGQLVGCTIVEAGPCVVTHVRTKERDGYEAVQLAFGERGEKNSTKAAKGHYAKANTTPKVRAHEFKEFEQELKLGDTIDCSLFEEGSFVTVTANSKGKGFQGVVKRHHFRGGDATHGSMFHRAPGSIGASAFPSRVLKGMRAAGHMGLDRVTVKKLTVVRVDAEKNLLIVKGSVPGPGGGYLVIRKADAR